MADYSLFLTTFTANLSASFWSFLDVVSPSSWVESKFLHAQRTPKLCPRLLPTFKAWLLSTRSFCFNVMNYGVFWSDNLEKSDQKRILSWRCHKFKQKRRYDKWNFAFFRLECERWQQLLRWCFETLIVCRWSLFVYSNTTLLELQTFCFYFFPKSALLNWGCGLSTDAAYTRTFTVFPFFFQRCTTPNVP